MELIQRIMDATSIKAEAGDYIKDGVLICGKCHTPKQVKVDFMGKPLKPMCLCKCEQEQRQREDEARQKREAQERAERLRREGFQGREIAEWTFAKDDKSNERMTRVAHKYVENFTEMRRQGKGLLLYGSVGTGKTFISACIANALIEQGYPCLVTNFSRLTNAIMGRYEGKQEYIDSLNKYSLLVIDDLASERDTEYMGEIVHQIIDSRYRAGLPLIITTNLTADELKHPADIRKQRIYSRLFEMCIPLEVKGRDRRKEKLREDYKRLKEMLGW